MAPATAVLDAAEAVDSQGDAADVVAAAAPSPEALGDFETMVLREALERGMRVLSIDVALTEQCALPAARAYMVFQALESLGDVARSSPSAEEIEGEDFAGAFSVWLVTGTAPDEVQTAVAAVSDVGAVVIDEVAVEPVPGSAAVPPPAGDEPPPRAPAAAKDVPEGRRQEPAQRKAKAAATVRVGTDKLDSLMNLMNLMNLMGEMVIHRTRLSQLAHEHALTDLRGAVDEMTRVTNDLQTLMMQVRMMPVEAVFMRFPRMVRDLAHTLGKRLELEISGEDTELDRTVIDELGDPLVHLLRNAVDHGLETPDEREAAGKDPVGTVWLRARHAGNSVVIDVEEDGHGIDPDRMRAAAVSKGVVSTQEAAALSDQEAIALVFAARLLHGR